MRKCIWGKRIRGAVSVSLIGIGLLLSLCGCSAGVADKKANGSIVVICKGSQHEFWQTAKMGAEDACEELGISMTFEAPEDETQIDVQIQMVEAAIEQKADGILLAPLDKEKLNPVIEKAHNEGIKVIVFDSDVTSPYRTSVIGTSNEAAGAIAARNAQMMIDKGSTVAMIAHIKGSQTAEERIGGFVNEMNQTMGSDVALLDTAYCDGDVERSRQAALEFIKNHPELALIYAANEGSAVGAAQAVEEMGKKGQIHIIGFDSSDAEISYLKSGVIDGMMVQNPYNMGYIGIRNLYKVIQDKDVDEKIDTGITYVDSDNVTDEDIEWLLYPMGKPSQE